MKKNYLLRPFLMAFAMFAAFTLINAQTFTVDAPASVAGEYDYGTATFGPQVDGFSGELVPVTDTDGATTACVGIDNGVADVTGKVALIDRGGCSFVAKALSAQAAGAVGAVICSIDQENPDATIAMGGADACQVTIPVVSLSFNTCQALRMETGVTVTYAAPTAAAGEAFDTAIPITDGTTTVDSITGAFPLFNATANAVYEYTAAADGVLSISSCGSDADTRLILTVSPGGCAGDVQIVSFSIDAGPEDCADNPTASVLEALVSEGQTYYIVWDDAQSADGFDFEVELLPLPTVTLELNVNMEAEEVSADGVNAVVGAPGVDDVGDVQIVTMSDEDGDGIYSGTIEVMTLDTIGYAFVNGMVDPANVEAVPDACGVLNAFGFNVRPLINTAIEDASLAPVCFGLCTNCPQVEGTFTVDMSNEEVGADGVTMLIGGPGVTEVGDVEAVPMTDNGDGTWSATLELLTGDTIGYAFMNGMLAVENVESVPDDCGLPSGFGFNIRPLIVEGFDDFSVDKVCFSTCLGNCPDEGCATTPTVFENMDDYTLGADITTESSAWVLWPVDGVIGGEVSDEQASSPPHSVKMAGGGSTAAGDLVDPLVNLGGVSSGVWDVRFKLYVPEGGSAYYNIQNNEGADPNQWNVEVGFEADGNLGVDVTGSYPQGEWFDVVNVIDVDNEKGEIIVNGVSVYTWTYGPDWSIGAINFFPRTASEIYYVDDVVMRPILFNGENSCPEGSIICDGFESYSLGLLTEQSAAWTTWSDGGEGGGEDVEVVTEPVFEGCNAVEIAPTDPDDLLLLLGNQTEGRYRLSWQNYVPAGNSGYYNLQEDETPGVAWNLDVSYNIGTSGPGEGINETTGTTFAYPEEEWFLVEHIIDLDNNLLTLSVDGTEVETMPYEGNLGGVDFFGREDNTTYYIDNVLFQAMEALPGNACAGAVDIQGLIGQGVDNPVTSSIVDNTNYSSISDPEEGYECFAEPGTGDPVMATLERTTWFSFEGDGSEYYMTTVQCDAPDSTYNFDTQIAVYSGDGCGNLTPVACGEDIDLAGGIYEAEVNFATELGTTYYVMVDGFGPEFESFGEYCLEVTQLTQSTVTVTFQVDASILVANGELAEDGMFIAGGFNDFTGQPMTEGADNIWTIELALNPGETYNYKFQNGEGGWEANLPTDECGFGDFGDRQVEVGDMDMTLDVVCFEFCVTCNEVAVDDTQLKAGVQVFPNPVKDLLNVRVDLAETADNLAVRMVNAFGQVVSERYMGTFQTGNIEIDVTNVPAGAYMIQVMDGTAQFTQSVIVE